MPFPLDKEEVHTEQPRRGLMLRGWTERAFGVWQDGRVVAVGPKFITIDYGHYRERRPYTTEFYYPRDHPNKGEAFTFKK